MVSLSRGQMDAPLATSALRRDEIRACYSVVDGLTEGRRVVLLVNLLQRFHAAVIVGGALRLLLRREDGRRLNWTIVLLLGYL